MADVFISYVEEDSTAARAIAERLADESMSSWRYETDAVAGPNYLLQTREQIEACKVFLVILSPSSVQSKQVAIEVIRAHECNRPSLPVLCELSYDQFSASRPDWQQALGGASAIAVEDAAQIEGKLDAIAVGVRDLWQRADASTLPAASTKSRLIARWKRRLKSPRTAVYVTGIAMLIALAAYGWRSWRTAMFDQAIASANTHIERFEFEEALMDINKAIAIDANDKTAYQTRGFIFLNLNKLDEAMADFDRALAIDPGYAVAWKFRGITRFDKHDDAGALEDLTKAIEMGRGGDDGEAYQYRAKAHQELNDIDLALDDINQSIKLDSFPAHSYEFRARIHFDLNHLNEAERDMSAVLERLPANDDRVADASMFRGRIRATRVYQSLGTKVLGNAEVGSDSWKTGLERMNTQRFDTALWQRALADFDRAIELSPDYWPAYALRGTHCSIRYSVEVASQGHGPFTEQFRAQAVRDFARSLELQKNESEIIAQRIARLPPGIDKAYKMLIEGAELMVNQLTAGLGTDADEIGLDAYFYANNQYQLGYDANALSALNQAIGRLPDFVAAILLRGRVLTALGRFDDAQKDFDRALPLADDKAEVHYYRGSLYHTMRKFEEAVEEFDKALELNPKAPGTYYARGFAHVARREYELAIRDYDEAIALNQSNAYYYYNRGYAYAGLLQYDRAIEEYTAAIQLNQNDANFYYWRGLAYESLGQHPEAVLALNMAVDMTKGSPLPYLARARVLGNLHRYEQAIADATNAIKFSNDTLLHSEAYFYRGIAQFALAENKDRQEQWKLGITDMNDAIRLGPARVKSYYWRGIALAISFRLKTQGREANEAEKAQANAAIADLTQFLKLVKQDADARATASAMIEELNTALKGDSKNLVSPEITLPKYIEALRQKYKDDKSTGLQSAALHVAGAPGREDRRVWPIATPAHH